MRTFFEVCKTVGAALFLIVLPGFIIGACELLPTWVLALLATALGLGAAAFAWHYLKHH